MKSDRSNGKMTINDEADRKKRLTMSSHEM